MEGKAKVISYLLSSLLFLIGGFIYIAFRTTSLLMFKWFDILGLSNAIYTIRAGVSDCKIASSWILYSLPDGLWTLSYIIVMAALWDFDLCKHYLIVFFIPILAIVSEVFQAFGLVHGTFDLVDLITYITATVLGIIYCSFIKNK